MLFVPFNLNVVWINTDMRLWTKSSPDPGDRLLFSPTACYVLEIHPDRWEDYQIGDKVEFQDA